MELLINGTTYQSKFGTRFIRELDRKTPLENNGVQYGGALEAKYLPELFSDEAEALSQVLLIGNVGQTPKLTQALVDQFIDEHEDIQALFNEVREELEHTNASKLPTQKIKKILAEQASQK